MSSNIRAKDIFFTVLPSGSLNTLSHEFNIMPLGMKIVVTLLALEVFGILYGGWQVIMLVGAYWR